MLDRLLDYARAQSLGAEPGFEPKRVRWALDFASDIHLGPRRLTTGVIVHKLDRERPYHGATPFIDLNQQRKA